MRSENDKILTENLLPRDGEAFYWPHFFSPATADLYFEKLLTEVNWREEAIRIFGKQVLQPRQTAWYGEKDYSYSGIVMARQTWASVLPEIKSAVESVAETTFNGVLLNHYRGGKDSMGWHRDNEKELGEQPVIASVSLGQTRRFVFRHREDHDLKIEKDLEHGSLLVMRGQSQHFWDHALPKTARPLGARINLTFRRLFDV